MRLRDHLRDALTREGDPMTPTQLREHAARTRAGLERARARGQKLGRPSNVPDAVLARIVAERETMSLQTIADGLNADGIPTAQGGQKWWPSTIKVVLESDANLHEDAS